MTFLAKRTRFGRYVFAIGGNPEAAELAGINTRWVIMKVFMPDGRAGRHRRRCISIRAPQRGDQCARHARRAVRHRRRGDRRHVACGRRRHRSPARCSARWSCSRCNRAWCCSASTRPCRTSWSAPCWSLRGLARQPLPPPHQVRDEHHETPNDAHAAGRDARHLASRSAASRRSTTRRSISIRAKWSALLGHNGAGKSTLIKILSGAYKRDGGADLHQWRGGAISQPARRQALWHRDDLPDAGARRQCRRRRPTSFSAARC